MTATKKTLQIELPMMFQADDYHELHDVVRTLNMVLKDPDHPKKDAVAYVQLPTDGPTYRAIAFDARGLKKSQYPKEEELILETIRGVFRKEKDVLDLVLSNLVLEMNDGLEEDALNTLGKNRLASIRSLVAAWCKIPGNLKAPKASKKK